MPIAATPDGWVLETNTTGYAIGFNKAGLLTHRYWGSRLRDAYDYPPPANPAIWAGFNNPGQLTREEFPGYEDMKFIEPCIKVLFADGVRDTVLRYDQAEIHGEQLNIQLRDTAYPLIVTLHYRVHAPYDMIERWVTLENLGETPITIERLWSAQWHLPAGDTYRLNHLTGRHVDEFHLRREPLTQGTKVLESRRITTSHHHSPWFAIDRGHADETQGEVWFGTLIWSGNWKIAAEVTDFASTRVSIGLNDWDFAWRLAAGQRFQSPASIAGYSTSGFGAASRKLHDYARDQLVPHPDMTHLVLYNSWEATEFDVDQPSQAQLAELAAEMGIELFVVDDGWFHGRNHDHAGLGDWWPDQHKFPNGLTPLIQHIHGLGMKFGLWIEPEMVNPDSELYRSHPDWVIHFPTRQRNQGRNQLILNIARQDVQDYLLTKLDTLLRDNDIAFIKWDMNRNVSEPGWPEAPGDQRELWVRYVEGLYHIWGTLRERHPHVIWQSCSGGGGRVDFGMLRLADQCWTSDNTEPTARLNIQEGYSQLFPASTMEAWVTDMGPAYLPLEFRFHVSMCGVLGVGGHLVRWGAERRAEAARWIAYYKQIREILHQGDCYRLRSSQEHPYSAVQYLSKDRKTGVVFLFRTHLPLYTQLPTIYLQGLDAQATYTIEGQTEPHSGAYWMHVGLEVELKDYESRILAIQAT
jgi:alpha-galactosidase